MSEDNISYQQRHRDQLAKWAGYHGFTPVSGEVVDAFVRAMGENQYGVGETWDAFCWFRNGFNVARAKTVRPDIQPPSRVMQASSNDCMRACVASLFGLSLNAVPDLSDNGWCNELRDWARPLGFGFVTIQVPNEEVFREAFSTGFLIVAGQSTRDRLHAVIYKDGVLWHDPHPESTGIRSVEQVDYFYPLVPAVRSGCGTNNATEQAVYCHACSKGGGAGMPIYHLPPACNAPATPATQPPQEKTE